MLQDTDRHLKIKVVRERPQRWLANQRNASWVIEAMKIVTSDGTPALVSWALMSGNKTNLETTRLIANDVVQMLLMPEIMVALNFEREMGLYFEVTSKWHGSPGELCSRPGFRFLELHTLWFEFIAPWWNRSVSSTADNFSETLRSIENIADEDVRKTKHEQVTAEINAGYNKIIKMSKFMLSVPLLFAALTDARRGPSLARAIVEILKKSEDSSNLEYSFDETWGKYNPENTTDKSMYDLIESNQEDMCHYFRQFGFGCACIEEDLKRLTLHRHEEPPTEALTFFRATFPILFEALEAKFGLMPSSTRIVEQKHGQLRDSLRLGVGHDFTDAQQQYITNVDYEYREERRHFAREKQFEKRKSKRTKLSHTHHSVKHDEGKHLQYQMGLDVLKVSRLYTPATIAEYPKEIRDKARVSVLSRQGTTMKDKQLTSKRMRIAEDRKGTTRKPFKTLEQYKQSAMESSVDNDHVWESIDEETKEKRADLEKLSKMTLWHSVPAGDIRSEVKKVLPKLWTPEFEKLKTKKLVIERIQNNLSMLTRALMDNVCGDVVDWSEMNRYRQIEHFIKSDSCEYLISTKGVHKKRFSAWKTTFECCGLQIPERERYKHNMVIDDADDYVNNGDNDDIESEDDDDDDDDFESDGE